MPKIPDILKSIIGGVVRTALAGVSGYLIRKGFLTSDQWEWLLSGITLGLITLVWSAWQKIVAWVSVRIAITLPPQSTEQDVKDNLKSVLPALVRAIVGAKPGDTQ
jgi:hypothetical protein